MQTAVSDFSAAPAATPDAASLLAGALDEEVALLDALRAIFASQREAVSGGDPHALDDGVFAATRVMRTLDEARRRRRRLTERLLGHDLDPDDLDALLAEAPNRPVRLAQDRLRAAAAGLRSEVTVLRRILEHALEDNRRYLDVLLGGDGDQPSAPDGYADTGSSSGAVVDRVL